MKFNFNDGGRADAGFKGKTGDCVVRAIAIATGKPYKEVYNHMAKGMKKRLGVATARSGVHKSIYHPYLLENGFEWIATSGIGKGCTVHLCENELPKGILIARVSKHLSCIIDHNIQDTYNCSRSSTRCVYGYYKKIV